MAEKEIRSFSLEFRAKECEDGKTHMIEGIAIPFNVFSPNREGFREMILPTAVEGVIEKSDIYFLYNHNRDEGFLARRKGDKGSLNIEVKEDGVHFSFKVKDDKLSKYIYERIIAEDLNEMSFAFSVPEDGEQWVKQSDGVYDRVISKFERLYDFSVVDNSYYGVVDAVTSKRFAEIQEEEKRSIEEAMKKADEEAEALRQEKIKEIHKQLMEEYGQYLVNNR